MDMASKKLSKKEKMAAAAQRARSSRSPSLLKNATQKAPAAEKPVVTSVTLFPSQVDWLSNRATAIESVIGSIAHRPQMKSALLRAGLQLLRKQLTAEDPKELYQQYKELVTD